MDHLEKVRRSLGSRWIPEMYEEKIRPLRTRAVRMEIPETENHPLIIETLLGIELKIGKRRIACPDMNTARYLQVFARAGCREIAVPYDITSLPAFAGELEKAWDSLSSAVDESVEGQSPQAAGRVRAAIIRSVREELKQAGAGELMPLFNKNTKQRDQ